MARQILRTEYTISEDKKHLVITVDSEQRIDVLHAILGIETVRKTMMETSDVTEEELQGWKDAMVKYNGKPRLALVEGK